MSAAASGLLACLIWIAVGPERVAAQAPPAPAQATPQSLLADRLTVIMHGTLAGEGQPRPDQLIRARILLDEALRLTPDDAERWRLRAEIAGIAGDARGQLDAWRKIAALDPRDDAVQLRLILAALGKEQTVEARAAAADRLLDGADAEKLSPALRSRVASLTARAARETGDTKRWGDRLKQALRLDPANAEAARLLHDFVRARDGSPLEQGLALVAVIRADPTDGAARAELASMLLGEGAYEEAAGQFAASRPLATAADPVGRYSAWVRALIGAGRAAEALERLGEFQAAMQRASTQPGGAASAPALVPLPLDLDLLRVGVLDQQGPAPAADAAFSRLYGEIKRRADAGDAQALGDLAWVSVLFGRGLDDTPALIDRFAQGKPDEDPRVRRLRGWLALRQGSAEEARKLLDPLVESDPFAAYGAALTYPAGDERNARVRKVQAGSPGSFAGVLAARQLRAAREPVNPSRDGAALARRVDAWPRWLRSPDPARDAVTLVDIAAERDRYSYLDPMAARVTIRNATDAPLSLGAGGVLPTRLFLVLSARRGGQELTRLEPLVIDAGRRLRLDPGEPMEFRVPLDRGQLGHILMMTPDFGLSLAATAVLDPYPTPGGLSRGPLGATAAMPAAERRGLPRSDEVIDRLIAGLSASEGVDRMKALAALTWFAERSGDSEEGRAAALRIAAALSGAFPKLDPLTQAWAVATLPATELSRSRFAALHEAAQRSEDGLVRLTYLAAQVDDPRSPAVNAALRQTEGPAPEFAKALRAALEQPAATRPAGSQ